MIFRLYAAFMMKPLTYLPSMGILQNSQTRQLLHAALAEANSHVAIGVSLNLLSAGNVEPPFTVVIDNLLAEDTDIRYREYPLRT